VEVVLVAPQPEVFVQPLEPEQAQRLVKIARTSRDRVRLRRAGIVLASMQGRTAAQIAQMFAATEGYVREVIHAFNDTGSGPADSWKRSRICVKRAEDSPSASARNMPRTGPAPAARSGHCSISALYEIAWSCVERAVNAPRSCRRSQESAAATSA